MNEELLEQARNGDWESINKSIEQGIDLSEEIIPLLNEAKHQHIPGLLESLVSSLSEENLDELLHHAVETKNVAKVEELIHFGANVHLFDGQISHEEKQNFSSIIHSLNAHGSHIDNPTQVKKNINNIRTKNISGSVKILKKS